MLRKKAEEKRIVAKLAYKEKCYNCAVSCYYYHIFLRVKKYLFDEFGITEKDIKNSGKSSHIYVIETIKNNLKCHDRKDKSTIRKLFTLKNDRGNADYTDNFYFNEQNYIEFEKRLNLIDRVLTKYSI